MPFVSECARYATPVGAVNVSSITQNFTHAVPVGDTIIMAVNAPVSGSITGWTITDSKGNTWTLDTPTENATSLNYQVVLARCKVTNAIATTDTYTIAVTGANPAKWDVIAAVFDDVTGLDIQAITSGSGVSPTLTIGNGSQFDELIIGAFAYTDSATTPVTWTPANGATAVGAPEVASTTSSPRGLIMQYIYVNSNTVRTTGGSFSASQGWGVLGAAYKVGSTAPPKKVVQAYINGAWTAMNVTVV